MTLEEAFQEEVDNQAIDQLVMFHASLQQLIDSGLLTLTVVDGKINPELSKETRLILEAITAEQSQRIADDMDREIVKMLAEM